LGHAEAGVSGQVGQDLEVIAEIISDAETERQRSDYRDGKGS